MKSFIIFNEVFSAEFFGFWSSSPLLFQPPASFCSQSEVACLSPYQCIRSGNTSLCCEAAASAGAKGRVIQQTICRSKTSRKCQKNLKRTCVFDLQRAVKLHCSSFAGEGSYDDKKGLRCKTEDLNAKSGSDRRTLKDLVITKFNVSIYPSIYFL